MRQSQQHRAFTNVAPLRNLSQRRALMNVNEAVQICKQRSNLIHTTTIAAIIGTGVVAINQLGLLLHGPYTGILWLRIMLNYVIPFTCSNLGVLSGSRHGSA